MSIFTDLAAEVRELDCADEGVIEEDETKDGIEIKRIGIVSRSAAERLGKRMGRYISIDAPGLTERSHIAFSSVSARLAKELSPFFTGLDDGANIVVVGLGNRNVTPDALGTRTAEKVFVTRHIKQYLPRAFDFPLRSVAVFSPGVLGTTGMETSELIKGLAQRIKPDLIIAIDSLASRRSERIGTTIQLSDAGIDPGSGVGNIRKGLNEETVGVPVLAIGVPLVVHAATITQDAVSMLADETGAGEGKEKLMELVDKVVSDRMDGLIVTPKDIDTIVADMSGVLAEGINKALFGSHFDEIRELIV